VGVFGLLFALAFLWFQSGGASWDVQRKMRQWPNPRISPEVGDYERELMERGLGPGVPSDDRPEKGGRQP
jgi:hypothetical protein